MSGVELCHRIRTFQEYFYLTSNSKSFSFVTSLDLGINYIL